MEDYLLRLVVRVVHEMQDKSLYQEEPLASYFLASVIFLVRWVNGRLGEEPFPEPKTIDEALDRMKSLDVTLRSILLDPTI